MGHHCMGGNVSTVNIVNNFYNFVHSSDNSVSTSSEQRTTTITIAIAVSASIVVLITIFFLYKIFTGCLKERRQNVLDTEEGDSMSSERRMFEQGL
uniref:NSP1-1 n=1 Tax=Ruddy turnstone rotavirus TaxID=2212774 RepID=A0A3G1RPG1_9REOV|nr:MAG: NSP1-1 [Ruddy turnstone rotavirus]